MNLPLFAKERTAAKLLDMTTKEFRDLVSSGALPAPTKIGEDHERWNVSDLQAILSGKAMDEDFQW
jgi:predicted DNA-binding transcriptional regulator AlpA